MRRLTVLLTERARDDIIETTAYIDDPRAAARYRDQMKDQIAKLEYFAGSLRDRAFPSGRRYRAFTFKSHIVFCRVDDEAGIVYVVRVFHGAQDYESGL